MRAWNSTLRAGKPMRRAPLISNPKAPKSRPKIRSRGMQGKAASAEQKRYHDALAGLGCIACGLDGNHQPIVSIHHVDGRTKPDAHWLVLALCAGHHQDGTGTVGLIAIHPWKARFEARYGTQLSLIRDCHDELRRLGHDVPEAAVVTLSERLGRQM